jgi:hypothetical protein
MTCFDVANLGYIDVVDDAVSWIFALPEGK